MAKIVSTYVAVLLLLSLGFLGIGALASATELRAPLPGVHDSTEQLAPTPE